MAYSNTAEAIEALAADIAENIYIDIAKWHLYLGDAKLHTQLAEELYPLIDDGRLSRDSVSEVLHRMIIPIGGGRAQLAMSDVLPLACEQELLRIAEDLKDRL